MRFLICGTAAAEGWPALFCACEACAAARARGGPDLRTRAAYMVGGIEVAFDGMQVEL